MVTIRLMTGSIQHHHVLLQVSKITPDKARQQRRTYQMISGRTLYYRAACPDVCILDVRGVMSR